MKNIDDGLINFFKWILLIIFYVFLSVFFAEIINVIGIKNKLLLNVISIFTDLFIALILIYLYRKDFKNKFKELNSSNGNKMIKSSIKIWFIGLILMITSNLILNSFIGTIAENESANRLILNNYFIYASIAMIIIAPICEEIIFRLSISKIINNKVLYIIFSGLLFGFFHVIGTTGLQALYVIPYTILGSTFAYIYQKHQNILCTILMHSLHNLICIMLIVSI